MGFFNNPETVKDAKLQTIMPLIEIFEKYVEISGNVNEEFKSFVKKTMPPGGERNITFESEALAKVHPVTDAFFWMDVEGQQKPLPSVKDVQESLLFLKAEKDQLLSEIS